MRIGGRRQRRIWQVVTVLGGLSVTVCGIWVGNSLAHGGLSPADKAGVLGLIAGVAALWVSLVALRQSPWSRPDLTATAAALALEVTRREGTALRQMRGDDFPAIDVRFTLHPQYRSAEVRDASGALHAGRLSEVVAFFHGARPRRLVITGEAGAGKTVLATELLLALLEMRQDTDPVPVRLSLASWDTTRSLDEWMVEQLVEDPVYDLHPDVARALVEHHRVLPVLDGLDEMDAEPTPLQRSRARAALAMLNARTHGRTPAAAVVTCRHDRYAALASQNLQLRDAAWIALQPVGATAAADYLGRRDPDGRWQPVVTELTAGHAPALEQALTTPWRLTLAVTAYVEAGDPADLLTLATPADVDAYLLPKLVPAVTELHPPPNGRFSASQVHRWLHELAAYLTNPPAWAGTPGTDLVLHRLWPIAGPRKVRYVHAAVAACIVMSAAAALSLLSPTTLPVSFVGAVGAIVVLFRLRQWTHRWPRPNRPVGLRALRTVAAAKQAVTSFLAAGWSLMITSIAASAAAQVALPRTGIGFVLPVVLVSGTVLALAVLACARAFGRWLGEPADTSPHRVTTPRRALRGDLLAGLFSSLGFAVVAGIAAGATLGMRFGLGLATAALAAVVVVADAWMRYIATLLCTRGRLPWQLATFTDWACEAGLLRISGTAYQFRHRELQEWFAANTTP
ncbi:NACHT domain-containing protein [Streptomyces sp. NBC_00005]|uniref:NACHT domain-containing protein n=1 Tax=Streptomyces sp. NBC_00005 TaxID=2903609 RepID=UPI0032460C5A